MPERICDSCGKKRSVSAGKTCENGHFACYYCVNAGWFSALKSCPLCKKPLR